MKEMKMMIKKECGGITVYSGDGKIEYAILRKLKNGNIVRIFVHEPICDGLLAEGIGQQSMQGAIIKTMERIRNAFELKKPGR